jgi:hypothetical protein
MRFYFRDFPEREFFNSHRRLHQQPGFGLAPGSEFAMSRASDHAAEHQHSNAAGSEMACEVGPADHDCEMGFLGGSFSRYVRRRK